MLIAASAEAGAPTVRLSGPVFPADTTTTSPASAAAVAALESGSSPSEGESVPRDMFMCQAEVLQYGQGGACG
jgi:hypothetical protein